jgi:hypothetical protein
MKIHVEPTAKGIRRLRASCGSDSVAPYQNHTLAKAERMVAKALKVSILTQS